MFEKLFDKFHNASVMPKVYYGLHFADGIARYDDLGKTILVADKVAKKMDATFAGKPVYVNHVDDVNLDNLQVEADGYVIESFFNKADGKHWAKFIIVSDKGHDALRRGWKLSNTYVPKSMAMGGSWHGQQYDEEIMEAEYEHLAIVNNPRYSESIVLTPDQFKDYNNKLDAEHDKLKNSKGDSMKLNIFKRQKVENSDDLTGMHVVLPKSGKEISIEKLVNAADEAEVNKGASVEAKDSDTVKIGDEVVTIASLKEVFSNSKKKNKSEEEEEMENEEDEMDNADDDESMENEEGYPSETMKNKKKKNEEVVHPQDSEKKLNKKKNSVDHFSKLANANKRVEESTPIVSLGSDSIARGKSRYGSDK